MTKYCINHLSTDWGRPGTNERLCILNMFRGCCADLITKIGHSLFLTQSLLLLVPVDFQMHMLSINHGGNVAIVTGEIEERCLVEMSSILRPHEGYTYSHVVKLYGSFCS